MTVLSNNFLITVGGILAHIHKQKVWDQLLQNSRYFLSYGETGQQLSGTYLVSYPDTTYLAHDNRFRPKIELFFET